MKHTKSHEIFTRAHQLMPGGVNSPARAFGAVGGEPIVFEHGQGAIFMMSMAIVTSTTSVPGDR